MLRVPENLGQESPLAKFLKEQGIGPHPRMQIQVCPPACPPGYKPPIPRKPLPISEIFKALEKHRKPTMKVSVLEKRYVRDESPGTPAPGVSLCVQRMWGGKKGGWVEFPVGKTGPDGTFTHKFMFGPQESDVYVCDPNWKTTHTSTHREKGTKTITAVRVRAPKAPALKTPVMSVTGGMPSTMPPGPNCIFIGEDHHGIKAAVFTPQDALVHSFRNAGWEIKNVDHVLERQFARSLRSRFDIWVCPTPKATVPSLDNAKVMALAKKALRAFRIAPVAPVTAPPELPIVKAVTEGEEKEFPWIPVVGGVVALTIVLILVLR
jgi:hypothetical protein